MYSCCFRDTFSLAVIYFVSGIKSLYRSLGTIHSNFLVLIDFLLVEQDEPESPAVEALISPRNSLVMRLTYLDPNLPPSPPQTHLATLRQQDKQERRLTKQINRYSVY